MKPENMTILTVDDTPANIRLLTHYLEKQGYHVITAEDGFEGFKAAILYHPDLVLLDIMMPGTDGYEVCELLKAEEETKDIPVVFLTAKTDVEDKIRGFELGAVDYITKPFNLVEISTRVQTQLHYKHLQGQTQRFYQIFSQTKNIANTDISFNLTEKKLNIILDDARKNLKKIEKNDTDGSLVKKEYEKTLHDIKNVVNFIHSEKPFWDDMEHPFDSINLNMLMEDIVDILQNQDDGPIWDIECTRLDRPAVISGNLAKLQFGLLNFFTHEINTDMQPCTVEIALKDIELPESILQKTDYKTDENFYCLDIISKHIHAKQDDLQDDPNILSGKGNKSSLPIINLQSVIQMHNGLFDIKTEEGDKTKVSIYLPKA